GRTALAGDAEHLLPVLSAAPARDLFADPFDDPFDDEAGGGRPAALLILDDSAENAGIREERERLTTTAQAHHVRVETVASEAATDLARYAALLATGTYAATYLGVGLGRS
ncbi:MAG: SIS domain-containing protein, partial [Nocardioidaceae bacterium]